MNTWFQKHREDVLHEKDVTIESGLSDAEVAERQKEFGLNQLEAGKKINPLTLFLGQFKDVLVIILLVAAVVSWGVGLVGETDGSVNTAESIRTELRCDRFTAEVLETDKYCADIDEGIDLASICATEPSEEVMIEICAAGTEESGEGGKEALLIFAIVIAIAVIGFFNEYKAEKTVEALTKLVGSKATVRRNGKVIEIDAHDVVPGDIVV